MRFSVDIKGHVWLLPALKVVAAWLMLTVGASAAPASERPQADDLRRPPPEGVKKGRGGPSLSSEPVLQLIHRTPESLKDRRGDYPTAALRMALDKTRASHGPYRLELAPAMNKLRTQKTMSSRALKNFIAVLAFDPAHAELGLDYLRFPLHFGAMGYRVCFVAPGKREAVANANTLTELKQFSFGQGVGWSDVAVLRGNGFKVVEVASYESLFAMLQRGRFDLLCRGVIEIQAELLAHPELQLDQSFAFTYPLPMFFYTHIDNRAVKERVAAGLQIAFDDGSLLKLFKHHFRDSLKLVDLSSRRIHRLGNTDAAKGAFDFQKYDLILDELVN